MPKFNVEESITIAAPIDKVYATVRDFKQWPAWSPWLNAEPDCQLEFSPSGDSYSWDGNIIGSGNMKIVDEVAPNGINYELNFVKPWKSSSQVRFEFDQDGENTKATWTMNGSLPVFMFWMKKMMVAMVGMDYRRGLKMLKPYIESGSNPCKLSFPGETKQAGCNYIGITIETEMKNIGPSMTDAFTKLKSWLCENKIQPSGAPFSITHRFDMASQFTSCTAAFPVEQAPNPTPAGFICAERPATPTFAIQHTGPYEHLGNAWSAGMFRARSKAFAQNKKIDCFEVYENDPEQTPAEALVTTVHFPIK